MTTGAGLNGSWSTCPFRHIVVEDAATANELVDADDNDWPKTFTIKLAFGRWAQFGAFTGAVSR
jgi:hypothetical protein